jgi:AcrR family transcriptional regulator
MYRTMKKSINTEVESSKIERSRGRPREFDRAKALEQATRLFWAKGYDATSISDLIKSMGIASPSLYAAFGSKEALYAEVIRHYGETQEPHFWNGFQAAAKARDAVRWLLMDTAVFLSGSPGEHSNGCMVALSSVGVGNEKLAEQLRSARGVGLQRLRDRLRQAVEEGEIASATDIHALARFVQTVQSGMSILARDGATREEFEGIIEIAMLGWDARTNGQG